MKTSVLPSRSKIFYRAIVASTVLGAMLAVSSSRAQSPLDSAPGDPNAPFKNTAPTTPKPAVPEATGTTTPTPAVAPTGTTTPPAPTPALAPEPPPVVDLGPSLLTNPDFEMATKKPDWPDDWNKGSGISWETEGGKHYLHLIQETPGKLQMAYREMPIPENAKGLKITIRYRTAGVVHGKQNWMDARAVLHFMDADRKEVAPAPHFIGFSSKASTWTVGTTKAVVPTGATKLVLMPALFMAKAGALDLAEVHVGALSDAEVDEMNTVAAAKAKKTDERQSIIDKELAMPAITPEIHVVGNKLLTADNKEVWLQGANAPQLSWSPNGEGAVVWSVHVLTTEWHANIIRIPVMDSFWFGKGRGAETSNDQDAYRKIVDDAVKMAAAHGAYVLLDLHRFLTPDQSCVDFWKDAAARYKNNPAVLFDLFNEPHGTSWEVWQKGGPVEMKQKDGSSKTVQSVGMQALIDAVRSTGANNIVAAGGLGYAYDLSGVTKGFALDGKGGDGLIYSTHFYNWHKGWATHFMEAAALYPIIVGETGADVHKMGFIPLKDQEDPATWVPDALGFFQKNHLNWTAWCFHTGATPAMLTSMDPITPNTFWGEPVKEALAGKQFEMKKER